VYDLPIVSDARKDRGKRVKVHINSIMNRHLSHTVLLTSTTITT
jgi:hypothetical protein